MSRIDGPSHRWLFGRVDALDAAMATALRAVVDQLLPHLVMKTVVAGGAPGDELPPPTTYSIPIDWQGLSIIQSLWVQQVAYNLMPKIYDAYADAAAEQFDNIVISVPEVEDSLPAVTSTAAEDYLAQAHNRMVGVGDRLWTVIRTELQAGVDAGESIDELKARLVASAGLTEPRAKTVARTEVISASNAGSFDQARLGAEAGLVMKKEWLATEDARTRPTHHAADGQKVDLNEPFTVGGSSLMFPGDPSGPADEIINCRCTLTYDVEDDEPLAIHASAGPRMSTGAPWKWDGLQHAEFCKSPLHPGPCKGAHPTISKNAAHKASYKKKAGPKAAHKSVHDVAGGHGGGGTEASPLSSHEPAMASVGAHTHSGAAGLSYAQKMDIYVEFKGHKGVSPAYSGKAIYDSVQHVKSKHPELSDADILDIIDEQGTHMGHTAKAGPTAYKDKVTSWLQTPNGKKAAVAHMKATQTHVPEAHAHTETKPLVPEVTPSHVTPHDGGDIGHLTPSQKAAAYDDYYKNFNEIMDNSNVSPLEASFLAVEQTAGQHGLTPMQAAKAVDAHQTAKTGFHSNSVEFDTVEYVKKNGVPGAPPLAPKAAKVTKVAKAPATPKPKKLTAEELPKPSEAKGYKSLPESAKLELGDSGISHISPEKQLEIYKAAVSKVYGTGNPENALHVYKDLAEKHGVSVLQVAQIHDVQWAKHHPYYKQQAFEESIIKHSKSVHVKLAAQGSSPLDVSALPVAKKNLLGSDDISHVPDIQKETVFDAFKTQGIGPYASDKQVFEAAQKLGQHLGFSPHQVLKIIDEQSDKQFGKSGTHHYETKGIKHLKSGAPISKPKPIYSGGLDAKGAPYVVAIPKNTAAEPGAHFAVMAPHEAQAMQAEMLKQHGDWTPAQQNALHTYTTSYYKQMNGYARSGGVQSQSAHSKVVSAQAAMRPTTRDLVVHRGANHLGFGLKSEADIPKLVGTTYEDRGFLSTSVGGSAAFGGSVKLTIRVPKGTHAAYVGGISAFKGEHELVIAAGTKYKVTSAVKNGSQWDVTVEVVP